MFPVHPETFERNTGTEELLLEEEELLAGFADSSFGSIFGWTPATPGPPPIYTDRLGSAFINRAPVRLSRPASEGSSPQKQDPRQTAAGEKLAIVQNALLRRAEVIRVGVNDFRLSWLIPQMAGTDALIGTLFLDTTTGLLSTKDVNGVVIPIGTGGTISLDFGGP